MRRWIAVACLGAVLPVVSAGEIALPPRPAGAEPGSAFARRIADLDLPAREAAILAEVRKGNVPAWWRRFVPVKVGELVFEAAPDYLAVGNEDDFLYTPLTPESAAILARELDCLLPLRRMVDAIYRAAAVPLPPAPLPPGPEMTTVAAFVRHGEIVRGQRAATVAEHPMGALVAGHKKDVVLTPQLAGRPGRVAIYGWHRAAGDPIQPLYLGHTRDWVDYSHGVRLVRRALTVKGQPSTIAAVLADDANWTWLSDEGPVELTDSGGARPIVPIAAGERWEAEFPATDVRVLLAQPESLDPTRPVRLVLYGLPAGNTIEQTAGRALRPGDDWHFNIQHLAAQTRWLRSRPADANLVVAYLECADRSWVAWRRRHADHPQRAARLVAWLRERFPGAGLVLTGHSAGGSLILSYLDGVDRLPDDVERIAFLDANYAYDPGRGHGAKLAAWLTAPGNHRLVVLAYEDHRAQLDGKPVASAEGGTWGRSLAMLADLGAAFPFTRTDRDGLRRHVALDGRAEFLLKENPDGRILHTVQVELNGFIHALLTGTPQAGDGYVYLGPRAYGSFIASP